MTTEERKQILDEKRKQKHEASIDWASSRFGINRDDVLDYNSGSCYDKVWVKTRAAAEKVAVAVKGETVNGGCFHGMSLGGITEGSDGVLEVMC